MSTNDKTGDQLANTIRKAKTGSTSTPTAATAAAPEKKAPAAKKSAPVKKKTASPAAKKSDAPKQGSQGFQHGRRVWPD